MRRKAEREVRPATCMVCGEETVRSHGGFRKCSREWCVNTRQCVTERGTVSYKRRVEIGGTKVTMVTQVETPLGCLVPFEESLI